MHAYAYSLTRAHTHACTFFCNVYLSYSHSLHIHAYVNISDVLFLRVCLVVRPSLIWLYVCYWCAEKMPLEKMPPEKMPLEKMPPEKIPLINGKNVTGKNATGKNATLFSFFYIF